MTLACQMHNLIDFLYTTDMAQTCTCVSLKFTKLLQASLFLIRVRSVVHKICVGIYCASVSFQPVHGHGDHFEVFVLWKC